jgi:hypothetical protein
VQGYVTVGCLFRWHVNKVNSLKTQIQLDFIQRFNSYRAVRALRLGYKTQSVDVGQGNDRESYKTQKFTLWSKRRTSVF